MKRPWKVVLWSCFALSLYLLGEAFLPAPSQPTARVSLALLDAYQASGSPAMEAGGIQCRYRPTCSHYAEDAIAHYGTLNGLLRTSGRLWRCSPWGGSGYDPAVETPSAAYLAPQQETPEERKQREQAEKEAKEAIDQLFKDGGKEAGAACAAGTFACAIIIISSLVAIGIQIFMMVFTYKDAKARGDQNAVLWLVLIFFLHWIGFVVYMIARPKGDLNPCPNCHQKKLEILTKCPHCGTELAAAPAPPKPPQP